MLLGVVLLPRLAFAQGAVQQSGTITAYDFACWYQNGIVFDCGISSLSPTPLPATPTGNLLGNATGPTVAAQVTPLTQLIDSICTGIAQGAVFYRDVSAWKCLGAGTNGFFLQTQGSAANPQWSAAAGTTYTAGTGLTLAGTVFSLTSPVTVALGGTGLASGTSGGVLAYTASGTLASSAALTQHGLVLGGGAGATPYPIGSLGTSGQVLTSNGASADPSWSSASSGTVTSIATSGGISGGTITTTGTITCVDAASTVKGCPTPDGTATHFLSGAGTWVAATNATYVTLSGTAQVLTGGFHPTAFSNGTATSGTTTVDCGNGPLQTLIDGGAFTLAMSANDGECWVRVTNNGSAGAITFSGFSVGTNKGDALTTTNTQKFDIQLVRIGGNPRYFVYALQ
jgi:hypothetical protein